MVHTDVYKKFLDLTGIQNDRVIIWFPNGLNSVRIRFVDYKEIVFTYKAKDNWRIETKESFIDSMPINKQKIPSKIDSEATECVLSGF